MTASLKDTWSQQCNVGAYQYLFGIRLKRHRRGICQVLHEQIFCTTGALVFDYVLSLWLVSPSGPKWLLYDSNWQVGTLLIPNIQVGLAKSFATLTLQQGQPGIPLKYHFFGNFLFLISYLGYRWLLYDSNWQCSTISIQVGTLLIFTIQVGLG